MTVPEFTYRIDAASDVYFFAENGSWTRVGRALLDRGQRSMEWLGYFAQPERDLMRVASAVLYVDRL